jgi:anti-sigma regulatory factor (Ser/Thr protein kinase)
LTFEFRCDESAPSAARQALDGLETLGRIIGDLMLIASELVTNAVLYSGCTDEDEIELQLERTDGHLRLSVLDPGRTAQSAKVAIDEQRASGGMGLFVVEHLAARWGADRSDRYRVRAEVPLNAVATGPSIGHVSRRRADRPAPFSPARGYDGARRLGLQGRDGTVVGRAPHVRQDGAVTRRTSAQRALRHPRRKPQLPAAGAPVVAMMRVPS